MLLLEEQEHEPDDIVQLLRGEAVLPLPRGHDWGVHTHTRWWQGQENTHFKTHSPEHRVSYGEALQPSREGQRGGGGGVIRGGHRLPPQQVHKALHSRLDKKISFPYLMKASICIPNTIQ